MSLPARLAFVAADAAAAQAALAELNSRYKRPIAPDDAEVVVALGGDGFMLETLHRFVAQRRADFRHAPRQRRVPDEPL